MVADFGATSQLEEFDDPATPSVSATGRRCGRSSGAATGAAAQSYPTRPIRLLVGFPAGGGVDIVARLMAQWLTERLGQPVVVENKPGAATNLATETALKSPPDGYTMLVGFVTQAVNASLYPTWTITSSATPRRSPAFPAALWSWW